ncbi:MAG: T9SS type A sorting domain-containing protein [Bacteroidales bacterium]|nr:T9SS type A sorting domain-containing protein [Bacteroidales bacterium]
MKKVLLLSLGLAMGFSAFAQKTVVKQELNKRTVTKGAAFGTEMVTNTAETFAPKTQQSVVTNRYTNREESEVIHTMYDLQSNSYLANRMYQRNNGAIGVVTNFSMDGTAGAGDRGTGYNYYDGSEWGEMPEARIEAERTGWPSIAPWGAEGEIIVNHSARVNYYIREKAGEGEWTIGEIPDATGLEGLPAGLTMTWPRVATSGANNDVIHVLAAAQDANDGNTSYQFYARSTDGAQTWEVSYGPLAEDGDHINIYSADDYAIATNGDNVALLYCGGIMGHAVVYLSNDNGLTWERHIAWENPYHGYDFETDEASLFDKLYMPGHGSVAIDKDGVAHVAMNAGLMAHDELGLSWGVYSSYQTDGIAYWNSAMGQPLQPVIEGDNHSALQLWLPAEEEGYVFMSADSVRFCGWIPPHPETYWSEIDEAKVFWGSTVEGQAGDYLSQFGGCASAYPSITVDSEGNLAVAYSSIDLTRVGDYYFRTPYVSYLPKGETQWIIAPDNFFSDEFLHMYDEATCISAVPNPAVSGEFVFSYIADPEFGFAYGTAPSQAEYSENILYVGKISSEYIPISVDEQIERDVVYNVYPNPASEMIFVSSSMDADATVTFTNLAGQTVKVVNANLTTGENGISINDLNSGIYFCTVKANGYSHTSKVVVK